MANEKDDQRKIASETIESLKIAQQANAQQGLNQEFKESINLLKKMNSLIEDSVSKTQTLEKSAVNTTKLKRELERIEKKQATAQREVNQANQADKVIAEEYLKNVKDRNKTEQELLKRKSLGLNIVQQQNELLLIESKISATSLQNGQIDLIAKMQANELLKERVNANKEVQSILKQSGSDSQIIKDRGNTVDQNLNKHKVLRNEKGKQCRFDG